MNDRNTTPEFGDLGPGYLRAATRHPQAQQTAGNPKNADGNKPSRQHDDDKADQSEMR